MPQSEPSVREVVCEAIADFVASPENNVDGSTLAELCGVSKGAVSMWCNRHRCPEIDLWPVIARAMGKDSWKELVL